MAQIPLNTQFIGLAATVDTTERRSATINAESAAYTMQDIVDTIPSGPAYKVYTALLTQSGTNNPVATVLENTLDGTPVWTRTGAGNFQITLAGAFPSSKTFFYVTSDASYNNGPQIYSQSIRQLTRISDDIVFLGQTGLNFTAGVFSSAGATDNFGNVSIEIRVYP